MVSNRATGIYRHRRAIGTFPNRRAVEQALHELRDSGFPMDRVSVVAQDSDRNQVIAGAEVHDQADNQADEGVKVGALSGGALGGLTGLLVGIGALAIPGIGPIMLAGAAATALATTAAGSAIGAATGSLLGGLIGMGIPEERARVYNNRISAGEYLVMVDGTDTEIAQAQAILSHRGIEEWGVYDVPATQAAAVSPAAISTAEEVRRFEERRIVNPNHKHHKRKQNLPSAPVAPASVTPLAEQVLEPPIPADKTSVRLYEERLIADKAREKTGEVAFGKHVEVETTRVSVPIEKERVVIERVPGTEAPANLGADAFQEKTMRVEVYEEAPDIRKEAFVREEVRIRKEVDRETVEAEETLRREELKVGRFPGMNLPTSGSN